MNKKEIASLAGTVARLHPNERVTFNEMVALADLIFGGIKPAGEGITYRLGETVRRQSKRGVNLVYRGPTDTDKFPKFLGKRKLAIEALFNRTPMGGLSFMRAEKKYGSGTIRFLLKSGMIVRRKKIKGVWTDLP